MGPSNFKVIVVGSGPVGLTAAHALTRANIDFVVLESRPSIVFDGGAGIVLLPTGMRVLAQLGLLGALDRVSSPLAQVDRLDHQGQSIGDHQFFIHFKNNHGRYPRVVDRTKLSQLLYDALPSDSQVRMLANKRVANVTTTSDGVVVSCTDGTSYDGSIVIGADGAHSVVRSQMRALALQASPAAPESAVNKENPYLTTYQSLWVRFPTSLGLSAGEVNETHGNGLALQLFAGDDTTVVALYERLDKPTRERSRYTSADEEALVKRWAHLPVSKKLSVQKVYDARIESGMVQLEEGVVEHWSWDRVVLVGDAAHKFTPSTGQGCNNGIIDVVVLLNELHKVVQNARARGPDATPLKDEITAAFKQYQDTRFEEVSQGCKMAGKATATATWENSTLKFVDRYVLSKHILQKFMIDRGATAIARSPVLDFIAGEEQLVGKTPWAQPMKPMSVEVK